MTKEKIALWLLPSQSTGLKLQDTIKRLARENNAPVFTPHLTLFVAEIPQDALGDSIDFITRTGKTLKPLKLNVLGVDQSDFFFKTLYVQFEMSGELKKLYENMKSQFGRYAEKPEETYQLNPHLSLLYKSIPQKKRLEQADAYKPPAEIEFDTLAYHIIGSEKELYDINGWEIHPIIKEN